MRASRSGSGSPFREGSDDCNIDGAVYFSSAGVGAFSKLSLSLCLAAVRAASRVSVLAFRSRSSRRDSRRLRRRCSATLDFHSMRRRAEGSFGFGALRVLGEGSGMVAAR